MDDDFDKDYDERASQCALTILVPAPTCDEETVLARIQSFLKAKGALIARALACTHCMVEPVSGEDGERLLSFPWFDSVSDPETIDVGVKLISKICLCANDDNLPGFMMDDTRSDRYAMRCLLARLGFVGQEHQELRAHLMKNLHGKTLS